MTDDLLGWERPARCNATNACVEVAVDGERVAVRNSREPDKVIRYTREEFAVFVEAIKSGQFDHVV